MPAAYSPMNPALELERRKRVMDEMVRATEEQKMRDMAIQKEELINRMMQSKVAEEEQKAKMMQRLEEQSRPGYFTPGGTPVEGYTTQPGGMISNVPTQRGPTRFYAGGATVPQERVGYAPEGLPQAKGELQAMRRTMLGIPQQLPSEKVAEEERKEAATLRRLYGLETMKEEAGAKREEQRAKAAEERAIKSLTAQEHRAMVSHLENQARSIEHDTLQGIGLYDRKIADVRSRIPIETPESKAMVEDLISARNDYIKRSQKSKKDIQLRYFQLSDPEGYKKYRDTIDSRRKEMLRRIERLSPQAQSYFQGLIGEAK